MKEERANDMQHPKEEDTPDEAGEAAILASLSASSGQSLEGQLEELKAEAEELSREKTQFREMLQRVQADFINYKRRAEDERDEQQKHANSRLILKLLPMLDEFDLAIDHASRSEAEAAWLEGVKLVQRKFYSLLESEYVTKIEVEGKQFDPSEHDAMTYQDSSEHQDGQILSVVRDGYKLRDRIIRPALVILAKNPEKHEGDVSPSTGKETEHA